MNSKKVGLNLRPPNPPKQGQLLPGQGSRPMPANQALKPGSGLSQSNPGIRQISPSVPMAKPGAMYAQRSRSSMLEQSRSAPANEGAFLSQSSINQRPEMPEGDPYFSSSIHESIRRPQPHEEAKQIAPNPPLNPPPQQSPVQDAYVIPKEDLKCAVCLDIYESLLCGKCCGALVCEGCKMRLSTCPMCRKPAQFERQSFLDHIMNNTEVSCRCGAQVARKNIATHKTICPLERILCPAEGCRMLGAMEKQQFIQHFTIYHKEDFMLSLVRKYATQCPT
jgi:hypothetical protein